MEVIPVMNKIDLPHARPEAIADQLVSVFDVDRDDIIRISAKNGINIRAVVDAIVDKIPPPSGVWARGCWIIAPLLLLPRALLMFHSVTIKSFSC